MRDLIRRLERAAVELEVLPNVWKSDAPQRARLEAKASGVRLALSYAREYDTSEALSSNPGGDRVDWYRGPEGTLTRFLDGEVVTHDEFVQDPSPFTLKAMLPAQMRRLRSMLDAPGVGTAMTEHVVTHINGNRYVCDECGQAGSERWAILHQYPMTTPEERTNQRVAAAIAYAQSLDPVPMCPVCGHEHTAVWKRKQLRATGPCYCGCPIETTAQTPDPL